MKNKTKKELEKESLLLYGGKNKKNPPFNAGDKLKQIWRIDDNDNLIKDGREMVEFVGMKGSMMLLKTLNSYAAHSEDTVNPAVVKMSKEAGYKPIIGDVLQLHYKYADRYEVVERQGTISTRYLILSGEGGSQTEHQFLMELDTLEEANEQFDKLKKSEFDGTYLYIYEAKKLREE